MIECEMPSVVMYKDYGGVDLICLPTRRSHKPYREWKKSQKKIRRERRQRMAYKKGGGK